MPHVQLVFCFFSCVLDGHAGSGPASTTSTVQSVLKVFLLPHPSTYVLPWSVSTSLPVHASRMRPEEHVTGIESWSGSAATADAAAAIAMTVAARSATRRGAIVSEGGGRAVEKDRWEGGARVDGRRRISDESGNRWCVCYDRWLSKPDVRLRCIRPRFADQRPARRFVELRSIPSAASAPARQVPAFETSPSTPASGGRQDPHTSFGQLHSRHPPQPSPPPSTSALLPARPSSPPSPCHTLGRQPAHPPAQSARR